jgi:diaminopimelate epimerase
MRKIKFTKMVASGNDFVVTDESHPASPAGRQVRRSAGHQNLAKKICDRKFGVGADGLLVLEKSKIADVRMRIFNADGSEAQMCGNGARCIALYISRKSIDIETKAGIIEAKVNANRVRIKLTEPKDIKFDIPVKLNARNLKVNFVDTGVPHAVIFVEGLDKINVSQIGRFLRYHEKFAPRGTNVNFVEVLSKDSFKIRTYERGVEDETLACGTGTVASTLIFALKTGSGNKIRAHTEGKEVLTVYFKKRGNKFTDVWLEGKAGIVCKGDYYV